MEHSTFYKSLSFNKLIIIDCLSESDYQTARRLHENLCDKGYGDGVTLIKIENLNDFQSIISDLKDSFNPEFDCQINPIIHIEAHGNQEFMKFPDKSTLSWQELANDLRIINILMGNQLVSFIGACHGYHFIHNNHTINKFTPVYFCIAPLEIISGEDIEVAALDFYVSLFSTGNLTSSAKLLNGSKFYNYNADYMFHRGFYEAMQKKHRGKAFKQRRDALISEAIRQLGQTWNNMSAKERQSYLKAARGKINTSLRSKESLRTIFDKFSNVYMGYSDEGVFEEIWKHMQQNKQGDLYR